MGLHRQDPKGELSGFLPDLTRREQIAANCAGAEIGLDADYDWPIGHLGDLRHELR